MDKLIFSSDFSGPGDLYPFTLTRQIQDLRVGILTIREKWERRLGLPSADDSLIPIPGNSSVHSAPMIRIPANLLPTDALVKAIGKLKPGQFLQTADDAIIAARFAPGAGTTATPGHGKPIVFKEPIQVIRYPWDIIRVNDAEMRADFALITKGRKSRSIPSSNRVTARRNIFLEKGAIVEHAILNASAGPIYIGKNAEVMEGACIRGPFALGEGGVVKMGAKIYGATSIGPFSIAAGEIKNTVILGYSNKAHDGYLGDSVIGEWCNMGAGTTNSNLKNNAGMVKMQTQDGLVDAGNKCGVMMGDYTRTAINTSINTGTMMGVCCNVFGSGLTPRLIPSFSWGVEGGRRYEIDFAFRDISAWKALKKQTLSEAEQVKLQYIYDHPR